MTGQGPGISLYSGLIRRHAQPGRRPQCLQHWGRFFFAFARGGAPIQGAPCVVVHHLARLFHARDHVNKPSASTHPSFMRVTMCENRVSPARGHVSKPAYAHTLPCRNTGSGLLWEPKQSQKPLSWPSVLAALGAVFLSRGSSLSPRGIEPYGCPAWKKEYAFTCLLGERKL